VEPSASKPRNFSDDTTTSYFEQQPCFKQALKTLLPTVISEQVDSFGLGPKGNELGHVIKIKKRIRGWGMRIEDTEMEPRVTEDGGTKGLEGVAGALQKYRYLAGQ